MAALTIRNVEDDLVRRLEERAAAEGVAVDVLHRRILEEAVRQPSTKRRMLAALEGLAWDDSALRPERAKDTGRKVER